MEFNIPSTALKNVTGKLKNRTVHVSLSFLCYDENEFAKLETLKESQGLVSIMIKEIPKVN